jgi:hypothetical protein
MAPDPFVPDVSTPVKLTTVIDPAPLCDVVAFTVTLDRGVDAKARQISAVPSCTFVRRTKVQVSPAPVTPVTVTPGDGPSAEMNASNNSFAAVVENDGDVMLGFEAERSVETMTSVAMAAWADVVARRTNRRGRIRRKKNITPIPLTESLNTSFCVSGMSKDERRPGSAQSRDGEGQSIHSGLV